MEPAVTTTGTTTGAEDVSGPCDEPEHATDPRCTGDGTTTTDDGEDRSGSGHDERRVDDDQRRRGPLRLQQRQVLTNTNHKGEQR